MILVQQVIQFDNFLSVPRPIQIESSSDTSSTRGDLGKLIVAAVHRQTHGEYIRYEFLILNIYEIYVFLYEFVSMTDEIWYV